MRRKSIEKTDVLLLDLRLPGIGGVDAIMALRKEFHHAV
jgi:CheY-like chemotaxis protein